MKKGVFNIVMFTLIFTYISCFIIFNKSVTAAEIVYNATNQQQMEDIVFNAIKNRQTSLKIKFVGDTSNIMNIVREARDNAVKRDPYEEGCISLISGFNISKFEDRADISFNSFQYYTTKEQEEFVNREVEKIVNQITNDSMNEDEKERAIHQYIISNVNYDSTLSGYTAYSALSDGVTVCNGYVQLVYKMMNKAGLETKIVKGAIVDGGNSTNHAWNMIKVRGNWYHLDESLNESDTQSKGAISSKYYNVTDYYIGITHSYDRSKYPVSNTNYVFQPSNSPVVGGGGGYYNGGESNKVTNPSTKPKLPTELKEIEKFKNAHQPIDKTWKISFNNNIDLGNIDTSTIFVVDSNGNSVNNIRFGKGEKDNVLLIYSPNEGYISGKTYYIYIMKDLVSIDGNKLSISVKIPFNIK